MGSFRIQSLRDVGGLGLRALKPKALEIGWVSGTGSELGNSDPGSY